MKSGRHWADMGEWSFLWGMRFLFAVYRRCGGGWLPLFLYPVVSYYWLANSSARRASQDYLNRLVAFAPELGLRADRWTSYRHFLAFAHAIIDKLAAWSGTLSLDKVEFEGRQRLLSQMQGGRGVVLLASHLGNPEVCRVIASRDDAVKINVLVHTRHAEKFNRLLREFNPNSGLNLLQVTEIDAAVAMRLAEKIDHGELIVIAADRTPVGGGRTTGVDFLGAAAALPQGPFVLAGLLQCPVFSLFCLKQQDKYRVIFEPFAESLELPRANRQQAIQAAAQRYAARLGHYCRQAPLQWFNFYEFWSAASNRP